MAKPLILDGQGDVCLLLNMVSTCGVSMDGGGAALTTGQKGYVTAPWDGTITGWSIVADGVSPTCAIDVWKVAGSTTLPTVTDSITAAAKPALASGNAIRSATLTGWTTPISANDIIGFNLDAVTTATKLTFVLEVTR